METNCTCFSVFFVSLINILYMHICTNLTCVYWKNYKISIENVTFIIFHKHVLLDHKIVIVCVSFFQHWHISKYTCHASSHNVNMTFHPLWNHHVLTFLDIFKVRLSDALIDCAWCGANFDYLLVIYNNMLYLMNWYSLGENHNL